MANIPLQSISFPGLSDKYTTPVVDNTLTQAGAAADAKKTGDELAGLKNDFTQLEDKVEDAYNAYVTETETGSIASFSDGADGVPVNDLTVAIEPVQDLHGQSAPYPAGGGKNKIDYLTCTGIGPRDGTDQIYGNNVSISGRDMTISLSYGSNGGVMKGIATFPISAGDKVIISGYATLSGTAEIAVGIGNYEGGSGTVVKQITPESNGYFSETITSTTDFPKTSIFLQPNNANSTGVFRDIMVEIGSSATPYQPYSNICPISGWTGANVTRTGKNLLKNEKTTETMYGVTFTVNNDGSISLSGTATQNVNYFLRTGEYTFPNGTFTLSGCPSGGSSPTYYLRLDTSNGQAKALDTGSGAQYTVTDGKSHIVYISVKSGVNVDGLVFRPQIEFGSTATAYEPYQGDTYEVDWTSEAGTVYGGTLDVTTGVLTVDRAMVDFGSLTWGKTNTIAGATYPYRWFSNAVSNMSGSTTTANGLCNKYATVPYSGGSADPNVLLNGMRDCVCSSEVRGYINVVDSAKDSLTPTEFKNAMDGTQFVYEFATPQTFQLTPQEVKTILGQNNIFADTGDVTVQYRADTKLYIDKVLNA